MLTFKPIILFYFLLVGLQKLNVLCLLLIIPIHSSFGFCCFREVIHVCSDVLHLTQLIIIQKLLQANLFLCYFVPVDQKLIFKA